MLASGLSIPEGASGLRFRLSMAWFALFHRAGATMGRTWRVRIFSGSFRTGLDLPALGACEL